LDFNAQRALTKAKYVSQTLSKEDVGEGKAPTSSLFDELDPTYSKANFDRKI
jgi:hypothetical protein